MSHPLTFLSGSFGASARVLLVDCTIRCTAVLALACIAALLLRRDSAATRHLVWLVAMVAMLVMPILSVILPQWRVLPQWTAVAQIPPSLPSGDQAVYDPPQKKIEPAQPAPARQMPVAQIKEARRPATPALAISSTPLPQKTQWNWTGALLLAWGIGFGMLMLRLLAAGWMLRRCERSARALDAADDPVMVGFHAACAQLRITSRVTLLVHSEKMIPTVWGLRRHRLLLPAEARHWDSGQLRSVLLHELAHIKRRDSLVQLLTGIACAVHWFNPLAWMASWRLAVERERACDDLVLASGVRPSAYAGHLLEAVLHSSSMRWTRSYGLAMARPSTLEGRVTAVLNKAANRRRVSLALAVLVLAAAAGVAVPVAMLRAAEEKIVEKLKPELENNLRWGQSVNGLRAAVVFRAAEKEGNQMPEPYLAVQNVSDRAIHLNDTLAQEQPRMLYLKVDGKTVAGLGAREPRLGDVTLQPHETVFIPMYSLEKTADGHTAGQLIADGVLKDTHQSMMAQMLIEKAPPGAWTGKLVTEETTGAVAAGQPQPKSKEGKALMALWQHHARANGNFPGGLAGHLGEKVKEFIRNNSGDASGGPYARRMAPLVGRFDGSHDWAPADVAALMDDVAAVSSVPLDVMREEIEHMKFRTGAPLPKDLANAPWGPALPSGLRLAWLFEPRGAEHPLGAVLKSRILIQNTGKQTIVFHTRTWHQGLHAAQDAAGAQLHVEAIEWLTRAPLVPFRLWPGEYVELTATGVGIGRMKGEQNARVGSWIEAHVGDDLTITTGGIPLYGWNEQPVGNGEPRWWVDLIKAHLALDLPVPKDPQERRRLVYRAGLEIFGTPLSKAEIDAFVLDQGPDPMNSLVKRFSMRADVIPVDAVDLVAGPTTFRVVAAPDDAK